MKLVSILISLAFILSALTVSADVFSLPPDSPNVGPVTKEKADKTASDLYLLYAVEVWQKQAKPFSFQILWDSPYFGAGTAVLDQTIEIRVWGGMIRVPEMREDILALIMCHEIGHLVGGAPYQDMPGSETTSVEGQADFYAASQCLPRYFQQLGVSDKEEIKSRITLAALGLFQLAHKYATPDAPEASLEKTAPEVATEIDHRSYPSDQCRLDTYKAGAACLSDATCRAPVCWLPKQM